VAKNGSFDDLDRFAYFEKLHFQELARRTTFSAQLAAPTAAIGAISAALCYLLAHFQYGGSPFGFSAAIEWAFLIVTTLAAIISMRSAYCLWLVARGQGYDYMPDPSEQHAFLHQLENWNTQAGVENPEAEAEEEFRAYLTAKFRKCASLNWRSNNYQSSLVYQGITAAGVSLAFLVIALVCYYIDFRFDHAL
jgi:hypothetical protein